MKQTLLVLGGAAVGGALGYFLFRWILSQFGYYGLIIPGGCLGLGAGVARNRSVGLAIGCGLAALLLGLGAHWSVAPFKADPGFGYLVRHVGDLPTVTQIMALVGGIIGFWVPFRRIADSTALQGE